MENLLFLGVPILKHIRVFVGEEQSDQGLHTIFDHFVWSCNLSVLAGLACLFFHANFGNG